jgi:hypothetical protein
MVSMHLCTSVKQTPVHFRRRRNLIRGARRVLAGAILFIPESQSRTQCL